MLTAHVSSDEAYFDDLRVREFSRLARSGEAYLDYTGSALYTDSQDNAGRRRPRTVGLATSCQDIVRFVDVIAAFHD